MRSRWSEAEIELVRTGPPDMRVTRGDDMEDAVKALEKQKYDVLMGKSKFYVEEDVVSSALVAPRTTGGVSLTGLGATVSAYTGSYADAGITADAFAGGMPLTFGELVEVSPESLIQ
jgi:hypothetical protein